MSLQGAGTIDGKGTRWWDLPCKPHKGNGTRLSGACNSPVAVKFHNCSNLVVRGLNIRNSPQFHLRFDGCTGVHINSITIRSPGSSPNTDGIHISNSNKLEIYNSIISSGDDCVSIVSGSYDVYMQNITCGPSHGISIGSLGEKNSRACVWNVTVSHSFIHQSDNGLRIKTWQGGSGSVSGVKYNHVHLDTVRNPIIIDEYYCLTKKCQNQTSAVYVSDITYKNITGTYIGSPAVQFKCSDSTACTNLTLLGLHLEPAQGKIPQTPFCWNAYGASQAHTVPPVSCLREGLPRSRGRKCF